MVVFVHEVYKLYTRRDDEFAIGYLGRYRSNPSLEHWKAAKNVTRYL